MSNPGSTSAGAMVYLEGYQSSHVLLKRSVNPVGNKFTGEMVGIHIAVKFKAEYEGNDAVHVKNIHIYIYAECHAAITVAFHNESP